MKSSSAPSPRIEPGIPLLTLARLAASVFLLAAGVLHLLRAPSHFEDDVMYGWFFWVVGTGQLTAGILFLKPRKPQTYMAVAAASLSVIVLWMLTRTVGVPVGFRRGIVEPAGAPDLAAATLEAFTAALLLGLGGPVRQMTFWNRRATGRVSAAALLALTAGTGGAVALAEQNDRTICHHHNPSFGPLAALVGHSILPEGRPPLEVRSGRPDLVLAGFLINCGNSPVEVTRAEPLSLVGDSAVVTSMTMLPAAHRPLESSCGRPAEGEPRVTVAPSVRRPEIAVYMRVDPVHRGLTYLNAVKVAFRYEGKTMTQPLATAVSLEVQAESSEKAPGC